MTSLSAPTQEGGLQSLNVGALRKKAEEARVDKEAIERVGQALAGACERQLHRAALDCRIFVQEERATTGGSQITRGIAPRRCHPRHLPLRMPRIEIVALVLVDRHEDATDNLLRNLYVG
jgi:hypothetical protein